MLDIFTIRIPSGPTNRSIGLFVDDERGLEREVDGEGFAKGTESRVWGTGLYIDRILGCFAGFSAACSY